MVVQCNERKRHETTPGESGDEDSRSNYSQRSIRLILESAGIQYSLVCTSNSNSTQQASSNSSSSEQQRRCNTIKLHDGRPRSGIVFPLVLHSQMHTNVKLPTRMSSFMCFTYILLHTITYSLFSFIYSFILAFLTIENYLLIYCHLYSIIHFMALILFPVPCIFKYFLDILCQCLFSREKKQFFLIYLFFILTQLIIFSNNGGKLFE